MSLSRTGVDCKTAGQNRHYYRGGVKMWRNPQSMRSAELKHVTLNCSFQRHTIMKPHELFDPWGSCEYLPNVTVISKSSQSRSTIRTERQKMLPLTKWPIKNPSRLWKNCVEECFWKPCGTNAYCCCRCGLGIDQSEYRLCKWPHRWSTKEQLPFTDR